MGIVLWILCSLALLPIVLMGGAVLAWLFVIYTCFVIDSTFYVAKFFGAGRAPKKTDRKKVTTIRAIVEG